ncbi:TetR/AcrR family transcriptional regulator [Pseudonocardia kujensis]|uniref:TetR/AcrR family transcriptional regulator n=1 Tax=Pseudonocardia kujensis TaxID=1128675 RepID=UPI001E64CECF|nr:TetR/AcrR family transcriptional regulator [Pseudonocardia kujensis]MCE0763521.1 TetR/AcrR family transcriptional regulator [Pseudonocardia kujensis]
MTTFQHARNEEQRELRRQAILDTADAMLAESPVSQVSLNELSRRVGLAKSNVLRYFDSREAILLELLHRKWADWVANLPEPTEPPGADVARRASVLAHVLATTLTARPTLCDLLSAQAGVLERNVSPEVAARFKRTAEEDLGGLSAVLLRHLPELGEADAQRLSAAIMLTAGAVWNHAHPSAAMLTAYEQHPDLTFLKLDFTATVEDLVAVLAADVLARPR